MNEIVIGSRKVGAKHPPFIIAEMSGNHNQSIERALEIVKAAADSGADAIKIQTYTAETMTLNISEGEFFIEDKNSLWKGKSLYELYEEAHTPWDWHKQIFDYAKELGIIAFSTPFDATAVDFLETLEMPCYKIASFENTDIPLIRKVAATGKPMIISTGMASLEEIEESVTAAREAGCKDLILLKCTSTYPASPLNSNIVTIPDIEKRFGVIAGLSDHTLGVGVAVASVALGACVIEKHFTLNRADGGVDSAFSLEPHELKSLKDETTRAWEGLGNISYGASAAEGGSKIFRRSLYIVKDVKKGEKFTPDNIRAIRPGLGLLPKYYDVVMGKVAKQDLTIGTPLALNHFE